MTLVFVACLLAAFINGFEWTCHHQTWHYIYERKRNGRWAIVWALITYILGRHIGTFR